jgi:hypothetical protein
LAVKSSKDNFDKVLPLIERGRDVHLHRFVLQQEEKLRLELLPRIEKLAASLVLLFEKDPSFTKTMFSVTEEAINGIQQAASHAQKVLSVHEPLYPNGELRWPGRWQEEAKARIDKPKAKLFLTGLDPRVQNGADYHPVYRLGFIGEKALSQPGTKEAEQWATIASKSFLTVLESLQKTAKVANELPQDIRALTVKIQTDCSAAFTANTIYKKVLEASKGKFDRQEPPHADQVADFNLTLVGYLVMSSRLLAELAEEKSKQIKQIFDPDQKREQARKVLFFAKRALKISEEMEQFVPLGEPMQVMVQGYQELITQNQKRARQAFESIDIRVLDAEFDLLDPERFAPQWDGDLGVPHQFKL